jgi:hypothetical protein
MRAATLARLRHMQAAVAGVDLFLAPSATLAAPVFRVWHSSGSPRALQPGYCAATLRESPALIVESVEAGVRRRVVANQGSRPGCSTLWIGLPAGSVALDFLGGHGVPTAKLNLRPRSRPTSAIQGSEDGRHFARPDGPILADLDVLVVPSKWIENAPFIIREAFAAGVPVVASNLGGMAEMVRHGVDGLLFPAGNAEALAVALKRMIDEPDLLDRLKSGIVRPMSIEDDATACEASTRNSRRSGRGIMCVPRCHGRRRIAAPS